VEHFFPHRSISNLRITQHIDCLMPNVSTTSRSSNSSKNIRPVMNQIPRRRIVEDNLFKFNNYTRALHSRLSMSLQINNNFRAQARGERKLHQMIVKTFFRECEKMRQSRFSYANILSSNDRKGRKRARQGRSLSLAPCRPAVGLIDELRSSSVHLPREHIPDPFDNRSGESRFPTKALGSDKGRDRENWNSSRSLRRTCVRVFDRINILSASLAFLRRLLPRSSRRHSFVSSSSRPSDRSAFFSEPNRTDLVKPAATSMQTESLGSSALFAIECADETIAGTRSRASSEVIIKNTCKASKARETRSTSPSLWAIKSLLIPLLLRLLVRLTRELCSECSLSTH
jgi:hypothetical protein